MRTGADTRLMPTLVAMGALYDSAVAASESIAVRSWADAKAISAASADKKIPSCYSRPATLEAAYIHIEARSVA